MGDRHLGGEGCAQFESTITVLFRPASCTIRSEYVRRRLRVLCSMLTNSVVSRHTKYNHGADNVQSRASGGGACVYI